MNDRFKFRLWDSDNDVFDYIDLTDIEETIRTLDSYENYFWSDYFKEKPEYLMQSTGLHDKNGKLIYEGDIVTVHRNHLGEHFVGRNYVIKFYKYQYWLHDKGYHPLSNFSYRANQNIEVIGNIYENKELLEEYKDE